MTFPLLKTKTMATVDRIIDTLVLAFSADPAVRWLYPKPQQYLQSFSKFAWLLGGSAFAAGTARTIGHNAGTALWLPPGYSPDHKALDSFLKQTVAPSQQTVFTVFEQMSHYHPQAPHWYLALLGVEPTQQRQGYGSNLMKPMLMECDQNDQLAYLESSNPDNIPFYKCHGFEVLATIQVNDSPPIFPMMRYPQAL